jgi:hypothetical protein
MSLLDALLLDPYPTLVHLGSGVFPTSGRLESCLIDHATGVATVTGAPIYGIRAHGLEIGNAVKINHAGLKPNGVDAFKGNFEVVAAPNEYTFSFKLNDALDPAHPELSPGTDDRRPDFGTPGGPRVLRPDLAGRAACV